MVVYIGVIIERWIARGQHGAKAWSTLWDRDILQFFLIGLVLFGLGLLGEYVGRIYQQVREPAALPESAGESWNGDAH